MGVLGYSTTAASNTTALNGVGSLAEGVMPIKQINDAIRQELADIAQLYGDVVAGITTTGTASAYVVATASGHAAYNNQMALRLRFHVDCAGGPTTVNVNVLGTKALKVFDTTGARDPVAGEIKADMVYDCVYVAALNCMIVTAHTNNFAGLTAAIAAKQDKDDDLTAIAALGSTGIAVRTAANTWAQRQIVSADGSVTITNPAGVAGDIDLSATQGWQFVSQFYTGTSVANVDTPAFESGYDYAVRFSWVRGATNPSDIRFAPFRVVAGSYPTAAALKGSDSNYFTGWLEILAPMQTADQHHYALTYAGFSDNNTTPYFGGVSGSFGPDYISAYGGTNDRISGLRFTRGSGPVSGGSMSLFRRPTRMT